MFASYFWVPPMSLSLQSPLYYFIWENICNVSWKNEYLQDWSEPYKYLVGWFITRFFHTHVLHMHAPTAYVALLGCWRLWEVVCSWHHWLSFSLCLLFPNLHRLIAWDLLDRPWLNRGGRRVASKDKTIFRKCQTTSSLYGTSHTGKFILFQAGIFLAL